MFARIGSFAARFRWYILAGWIAVALVLTLAAPNIDSVAVSDQSAFLPSSSPALEASDILKRYFPNRASPSSAVVVIDAGTGKRVDQGAPAGFVAQLTTWLSSNDAPKAVEQVMSPTLGDEQTKAQLTSKDKQVALVVVRLSAAGGKPIARAAMVAIQQHLDQSPPGVKSYLTGDGPILSAYNSESKSSIASTTWITILLVVVILLLIYRSPVSPIIPLTTIAIAYLISRGVVALLGAHVLTISIYTNVFLIVVLFGAGTDYCLFLISRFREEKADTPNPAPAIRTTVRAVGETIASSAGTVIVGLATMATAELGLYNTSGPSLAIGVAIALLAGLTLTPAMLCLLGDHSFWPRKARHMKEAGIWHLWAGRVIKRPLLALLVPVIVLVPLAIYGTGLSRDFDLLGDLPKSDSTRQGFDVLAAHLGPGSLQPLNVVAIDPQGYDTPSGLSRMTRLQARLAGLADVTAVRSFTSSLPDKNTLSVADQLGVQAKAVRAGISQLNAALTGGGSTGGASGDASTGGSAGGGQDFAAQLRAAAAGLLNVYGYLSQLAQGYPDVLQDHGYQEAVAALQKLSALAQTLGTTSSSLPTISSAVADQALTQLGALADALDSLQRAFATRPGAILLPNLYLQTNKGLKSLRDAYISSDGTATRLQVVLSVGPYTPQALTAVQTIRQTLSQGGFNGVVEGSSAVLLDLRAASDRDMVRALIFVLAGIFVVLLLLLRALVAPIYLILTILLSYTATLGMVRLLFVDLLGAAGIVWWVPMFMFVMLVALGMDYNIFLIGRVKEEVANRGTRPGTRLALARTGGIITSAGIIMAGTFASMMSASILGLLQIGFAVAFGVLLDTFVVRTTVVPAITVLLGRWAWWPRHGPGGRRPVNGDPPDGGLPERATTS